MTAAPTRVPGPHVSGDDVLPLEPATAGVTAGGDNPANYKGLIGNFAGLKPGAYETGTTADGTKIRHHVVGQGLKDLEGDPGKLDDFASQVPKAIETGGWVLLHEDAPKNAPVVRHMGKNIPGGVLYVVSTFWRLGPGGAATSASPLFLPDVTIVDREILPGVSARGKK